MAEGEKRWSEQLARSGWTAIPQDFPMLGVLVEGAFPDPQPPLPRNFHLSYHLATGALVSSSCTLPILCSSGPCPTFINPSLPCNNQYLLCLCQLADGRIMGEEMAGNLLYKLRNTKTRERHHVEEFHSQLGRRQAVLLLFLKE